MKFLKQPRLVWPLIGFLLLPFAYQNCANQLHSFDDRSPNTSPFQSEKIQFSQKFEKMLTKAADGATLIPRGSKLVAIVQERCLKDRKNTELSAKLNFIEKYLPSNFYSSTTGTYDQYPVRIQLQSDVDMNDLKDLFARDVCLVGVGEDNSQFTTAVVTGNQTSDLYQQIEYTDGENLIQNRSLNLQNFKVKVALIDTGLDQTSTRLKSIDPEKTATDLTTPQIPKNDPVDADGHGTAMAHLLAGSTGTSEKLGLVPNEVTILPIKIALKKSPTEPDKLNSLADIIHAIRRAVNGGAEIINMSFAATTGEKALCSPVLGQAIFYGIERGVLFSMSAGNFLKNVMINTTPTWIPGEFQAPREIGMLEETNYTLPGCWGNYFKGAMTSTAIDGGFKMQNVNYGQFGIELGVPTAGISTYTVGGQKTTVSGTSPAAVLTTAALARIISFHKAQGWKYSPFRVEDILVNSQVSRPDLLATIRNGKTLNWKSLSNYLIGLMSKTADERRREPSDDVEGDSGFRIDQIGSLRPTRIEFFTQSQIVSSQADRIQFHVVAYYANGSYKSVTREAALSVSDPAKGFIDSNGILYPKEGARGLIVVNAAWSSLNDTSEVYLADLDTTTGVKASIADLQVTVGSTNGNVNLFTRKVIARYEDGTQRDVTSFSTVGANPAGVFVFPNGWLTPGEAFGGQAFELIALYRGRRASTNMMFTKAPLDQVCINVLTRTGLQNGCETPIKIYIGSQLSASTEFRGSGVRTMFDLLQKKIDYSDCPFLENKLFQPFGFDSTGMPAKVCQIKFSGKYRGMGTEENKNLIASIELVADPIVSLGLASSSVENNTIYLAGEYRFELNATTQSGQTYNLAAANIQPTIKFSDGTSTAKNFLSSIWDRTMYFQFYEGEDKTVDLTFLHTPSGKNLKISYPLRKSDPVCTIPASYAADLLVPKPNAVAPTKKVSSCSAQMKTNRPYASGTGAVADPYLICHVDQLFEIKKTMENISSNRVYYKLADNLDLESLGNLSDRSISAKYGQVYFDGDGYSIENVLMIDSERTGLTFLSRFYEIKNVIFSSIVLKGYENVYIADAYYFKSVSILNSQLEVQNISVAPLKGIVVTGALVLNTSVKGRGYVAGLISSGAIFNVEMKQVTVRTNGVPGGGSQHSGVTNRPSYAKNVNAVVDVLGDAGVAGFGSSMPHTTSCIQNIHIKGKVEGRGDGVAGIVSYATSLLSVYSDKEVVIQDSSFDGELIGRNIVGGIVGETQRVALINNQVKGTITAQGKCGAIAEKVYHHAYFQNNQSTAVRNCPNLTETKPYGEFILPVNIQGATVPITPFESGNVIQ